MGQKVSPVGIRLGIIRDWDSKWYANKAEVPALLHEDLKIRKVMEAGPEGGIVDFENTRILEVALRRAWEAQNAL